MLLRSSLISMVGVRLLSIGTTVLALVTYSRLLQPRDFGLLAMISTTIQLAALFRDFGLTTATVQRPLMSEAERDATFWLNGLVVSAMSLALVAATWPVAQFYREPGLKYLLLVSVAAFFLSGIASQHAAVLRRELRFSTVAAAEAMSALAGISVGVLLAWVFRNAWAFVIATLLQSAVSSWIIYRANRWLPRSFSVRASRSSLHFGAYLTVFTVLNFFTNNIIQIMIGRLYGAAPLGQFNRAQQIFWLPHNLVLAPTASVMLPALARGHDAPDNADAAYRQFHRRMAMMFIPAACVLPSISAPLVRVVLGPGWDEAGKILGWFAFALAAHGVVNPGGTYLMALGRTKMLAIWGLFDLLFRGGGALIGLQYGPVGAAAGFSMATILFASPATFFMISRGRSITIREQMADLWPGLVLGGATGGVAWLIVTTWDVYQSPWAGLALVLASCGAAFAALTVFIRPIRGDVMSMLRRRA